MIIIEPAPLAGTARQALTKAMDADPQAAETLRNLSMRGWEPGQDKDWDDLRKLPLDMDDAPVQQ
jgi:hypothetical protein